MENNTKEIKYEDYAPIIKGWIVASGRYLPWGEFEDLLQIGAIAFVQAEKVWDGEREFKPLLKKIVMRRIDEEIKKQGRIKHDILTSAIDKNVAQKNYDELGRCTQYIDEYADPFKVLSVKELWERIRNLKMSSLESQCFVLHMMGYTMREISDLLDCSLRTADNALQRIKLKVKRAI